MQLPREAVSLGLQTLGSSQLVSNLAIGSYLLGKPPNSVCSNFHLKIVKSWQNCVYLTDCGDDPMSSYDLGVGYRALLELKEC